MDSAALAHEKAIELAQAAVAELRRALESAHEIRGNEDLAGRAEQFEIEAEIELGLAEARLEELRDGSSVARMR